jgi:hypothetical protein
MMEAREAMEAMEAMEATVTEIACMTTMPSARTMIVGVRAGPNLMVADWIDPGTIITSTMATYRMATQMTTGGLILEGGVTT